MPILANYQVRQQVSGTEPQPITGGSLQLGENVVQTASPSFGCTTTGLTTDWRAGQCHPASVLGTGMNPDLVVWGPEAV
jgi:hypothetical protein